MDRRRQFLDLFDSVGAGTLGIEVVDTLADMGFFTAPASTKYHGAYEGGLFDHSLEVTRSLVQLTKDNRLIWEKPRSPVLVGMFHDLCKCDSYRKQVVQVGKTLEGPIMHDTGKWEHAGKSIWGEGHGDKSVFIASTLCKLTYEEALCIRYHMGAYKTDDWDGFDAAIRKYQNVLWTHHADMIASKVVGV